MNVEAMYQEIILDHYKNPHGRGLRDPFEAEVHHINPTCGDEITLRVHLEGTGEQTTISDVSYQNQGCSISQASASVLYDQIVGMPLKAALAAQESFLELMQSKGEAEGDEDLIGDGVAFAGVAKYPARVKCALLAWMAWRDATAQALAQDVPEPVLDQNHDQNHGLSLPAPDSQEPS